MKRMRRIVLIALLYASECFRPPNLWDVLGFVGLLLLSLGLWLVYPPASLIATGLLLMVLSLWGALTWTKESGRKSLQRRAARP